MFSPSLLGTQCICGMLLMELPPSSLLSMMSVVRSPVSNGLLIEGILLLVSTTQKFSYEIPPLTDC
ncbi:hypothetical protein AAHA92_22010 [Salvia divinorum]|uniref:Uncharacterized protein n=1 Tax=Salvia divinorum TaxID=28513 RepID=A0ABD1GMS5_SALDI